MNTTLLQYAVEVEKTGSITQAANRLYMDQPNLSKAIKSLEESLGAPIFTRTAKGMIPTPKGKVFLEYARSVLAQIAEMETLYKPVPAENQSFGLSMPRASYLSLAFSRFLNNRDKNGELSAWIRETNTVETIQNVESQEYGLGIIRYQKNQEAGFLKLLEEKGLDFHCLWEYEARILMSRSHPLGGQERIHPESLKNFIQLVHGDVSLQAAARHLPFYPAEREAGRRRIYVFDRGSQFDILNTSGEAYMWVSPIPPMILQIHGLVLKRSVSCDRIYKDVLIGIRGRKNSDMEKKFLEEVRIVIKEIEGTWEDDGSL